MNNLEQIITDYLQAKETDYAIMINGDWGCGKTYYIRNILTDNIKKIKSVVPTSGKAQKKNYAEFKPYELVYVSLYGISNVNDIYTRILASLFPVLQNKLVSMLKIGLNRIVKLKNIDGISDEEKKAIESFIGIPKNKVLCFDDLERISSNLDIQEVLGFLNTYTEHQNLKVLIICNDNKIQEKYTDFKEKTVRFTYKYQASISDVYDNIISNRTEKYRQFLKENKDTVIQIFNIDKYCNLRTLRFVIEVFQKLYDNTIPNDLEFYKQVLHRLFFFTTIYSIEYKEGQHSKTELDSLEKAVNYFPVDMFALLSSSKSVPKEEKKPEYFESFAEKYNNIRSQFFYYSIIADYIHFGVLEIDKFKNLIKEIDKEIKSNEKTEESIIIEKLRNWELIEDTDFMLLIKKTLEKVEKAEFNLYTYPTIYAQLVQFDYMQIENFKITKNITDSFKAAIDKNKAYHKYFPSFNMSPIWDNSDKTGYREKYLEIYDYALRANEDVRVEERKNDTDNFLTMIKNNEFEKLQNYMFDINKRYIIENIEANDVWTNLVSANIKTLKTFVYGIGTFYPDNVSGWSPLSEKEKVFFNTLKSKVNKYNQTVTPKPLRYAFIIYLENKIDSGRFNLQSYKNV